MVSQLRLKQLIISLVSDGESMKTDGLKPINCLREGSHYKFLGVRESVRQEDGLVLKLAAKEFLRRVSVIWSSPLYDHVKAVASNQYAVPVLNYLSAIASFVNLESAVFYISGFVL